MRPRRARRTRRTLVFAAALFVAIASPSAPRLSSDRALAATSPIKHVVILYLENHTFDNVFGAWCHRTGRCNGVVNGRVEGRTIRLKRATDIPPDVEHGTKSQRTAISGGRMDRFDRIEGCEPSNGYRCYQQYRSWQIPNLISLARHFVLSDRTFQMDLVPTWGAHLELVAGRLDGFVGDVPFHQRSGPEGPGWGCNSFRDTMWRRSRGNLIKVPACVPDRSGKGPYRPSPVPWVPTIMDRLDRKGLTWGIYSPGKERLTYGWAICPSFSECLNGPQHVNMLPVEDFPTDAAGGHLPNLSIIVPQARESQHNGESMRIGDNWIGKLLSSIMHGPDWASTAVFITYDDFGGFYDHVAPSALMGLRVPMVIVSPYAKPGFVDSRTASFASMLAFVEKDFGLTPLAPADRNAYAYGKSFDYSQTPLPPISLTSHPVPAWERAWLRAHPGREDEVT